MYDIDAGRGHTLRFDAINDMISADEEIAAIEKQMEALSLRHCELMEAKRVAFAQSRPIPVSPNTLTMSNDFWDHRPRTMTGPDPLVARSNGYVERLHPLAAREVLYEDDGA